MGGEKVMFKKKSATRMKFWLPLLGCVAAIVILLGSTGPTFRLPREKDLEWEVLGERPDYDVAVTPSVKPYTVDSDLSNVERFEELALLAPEQKALLAANGFLVLPSASKEFYEIYYKNPAPLVTADCLLHAYHVLLAETLAETEKHYLAKRQATLALAGYRRMKEIHAEIPKDLRASSIEAVTYWAVAAKLADAKVRVSEDIAPHVETELQRIRDAAYIGLVANEPPKRDYTIFKPIAGYAKSDVLRAYFVLNRYFTMWTLEFKSDAGARSCMLVALAVGTDKKARRTYMDIARYRQLFGGIGEDPTPITLLSAAKKTFGSRVTVEVLTGQDNLAALRRAVAQQPKPEIADQPQVRVGADPQAGYGMRMFAPGVSVRNIAYQQVAETGATPRGEHMAAVLGSELPAVKADLPLLERARTELDARDKRVDKQDLHTLMMLVLRELPRERGKGYPSFMNTDAWAVKTANTQMGSWSEVEHDLCLYVKDNACYMCFTTLPKGFHGYVEPTPQFYAALAATVSRTRDAFRQMGVFKMIKEAMPSKPKDAPRWWRPETVPITWEHFDALESLLRQVRDMAVAELENRGFNDEQVQLLKHLSRKLKHLALNDSTSSEAKEPMSVVVRIAREYLRKNGRYVGVGRPLKLIAIVPYDGKLHWCTGGVYSYYEFDRPLNQQLDDRQWKRMTSGVLAVQPYKPWLIDKNVGVDAGKVSVERIRAWLPTPRTGWSCGGSRCERILHSADTMQALNRLGTTRLTDAAMELTAKVFIEGRYDRQGMATLYVLLRSAPSKRRAVVAAAAMREFEKEVGTDDHKFSDCNNRAWLYFALRLHEGITLDNETAKRTERFRTMADSILLQNRDAIEMTEMIETMDRLSGAKND